MTQQPMTPQEYFNEDLPPMRQQFPHQAPKVPFHKTRLFFILLLAAAVLFGAAVTGAFNAVTSSTKAANCKAAFEYADTGMDASGNVIGYLTDGLSAAAYRDSDALNDLAPKIEEETNRLDGVPEKFKTARELCEK